MFFQHTLKMVTTKNSMNSPRLLHVPLVKVETMILLYLSNVQMPLKGVVHVTVVMDLCQKNLSDMANYSPA